MRRILSQVTKAASEFRISSREAIAKVAAGDLGYYAEEGKSLLKDTTGGFKKHLKPLEDKEKVVLDFSHDTDLSKWTLRDDRENGGATTSKLSLELIEDPHQPGKTMHALIWSGVLKPISLDKKPAAPWYAPAPKETKNDKKKKVIPGYAGIISPRHTHNLDRYHTVGLDIKTDGRQYYFNIIPGGLYQHRDMYQAAIAKEEPRPMHEKQVDFQDFRITHKGYLKFYQEPLNPATIQAFTFGVQGEGPFRLELARLRVRAEQLPEGYEVFFEPQERSFMDMLMGREDDNHPEGRPADRKEQIEEIDEQAAKSEAESKPVERKARPKVDDVWGPGTK